MRVKSIRQLAGYIGKTHTMLNKDKKHGKFEADPDGWYDVDKVRSSLTANASMEQPSQAKGALELPQTGTSYEIYNKARAAKEIALAQQAQLDLKVRQAKLLDADAVDEAVRDAISISRNNLLLVPAKISHKLAVISDPTEAELIVSGAIKEALQALSEMKISA